MPPTTSDRERPRRTLDVGCGRGELGLAQVDRGDEVVAIDIDFDRLTQAARRAGKNQALGRMAFVRADAARLPFRPASFDHAMCFELLEHVDDPAVVLSELRRVVAAGAELELSVPTWRTEQLFRLIWPEWLAVCTHRRIFRRAMMTSLLRERGFHVDHVEGRYFYWAYFWLFHCFARTRHDGTGRTDEHQSLTRVLEGVWDWLESLPGWRLCARIGNRVFPKSVYFRCHAG